MVAFNFIITLAVLSTSWAHPMIHEEARDLRIIGHSNSAIVRRQEAGGAEFTALVEGNKAFRAADPTLLQKLADNGQEPPFMFLGCSDSRVSEGTVFGAKPGTFFTQRNIANQFQATDPNAQSVLAYGVAELGVKHVIVMGHYGCGGVAAAIASPPAASVDAANGAVQAWIDPIRELFRSSSRPEIVTLRESIQGNATVEEPDLKDPGFRALVEENVKVGVGRIASDSVIVNHYSLLTTQKAITTSAEKRSGEVAAPVDVFIHGWVYDIANGEVRDLGVSVGPPGKAIPPLPFGAVAVAAEKSTASHQATAGTGTGAAIQCAEKCKSKRSFLPRNY